jgi:septum formation topological specificity factor MinE
MKLLDFLKRPRTALVARERLQILHPHERAVSGKSDLIAILQEEIMAVIQGNRTSNCDQNFAEIFVTPPGSFELSPL